VLDVTRVEPLPSDDRLWSVEHLYLTSHTAAPSTPAALVKVFCDNYLRYVADEPLQHRVDFERGY
jgi:phosphoglycerate dehydrogenase-like enzyme